ncbi:hypothetical protein K501DRAFT_335085 [Backusella circina FSU 941]|nr:hypothetical protein K501DRAFT_335085 [Backusella circina FSU 941]
MYSKATFCPPLDASLVSAIWNDSQNYDAAFSILSSLAAEADKQKPAAPVKEEQAVPSLASLDIQDDDQELKETITFLHQLFPGYSAGHLKRMLLRNNQDVEKTTNDILNQGHHDDDIQEHKKRKKPTTVWNSGQLPSSKRQPSADQDNDDAADADDLATVPFNVWTQYDPVIAKLKPSFPHVPEHTLAACVQKSRGNIIASVSSIMEKVPEARPEHELTWSTVKDLTPLKRELQAIMMDRTEEQVHRVAVGTLIQCQDNNKTIEQMTSIGVEFFLKFNADQVALEARLKQMARESEELRKKAKQQMIPVLPDYLLINNQGKYVEDDPDECRDVAIQLILERNELFRKAAESYRRAKNKGPGSGGVAFYYSDNARQIDVQARDWNLRAARALVRRQRLKRNDDHLLDLHGLTVSEAHVLIQEGVTQWWSRSQMQAARRIIQPLHIITGKGSHSEYGEAKLFPSAIKYLKTHGWVYDIPHAGSILVKGVKN